MRFDLFSRTATIVVLAGRQALRRSVRRGLAKELGRAMVDLSMARMEWHSFEEWGKAEDLALTNAFIKVIDKE